MALGFRKTQSQRRLEEEIRKFTKSLSYQYPKKKKRSKKKKIKLGKRQWKEIDRMSKDFLYHFYNGDC